ncbi:MAG TPA: GH92 family glycosyl hydrolase [Fontimonas sp.]
MRARLVPALLAAILLAGCGGSAPPDSAPQPTDGPNQPDNIPGSISDPAPPSAGLTRYVDPFIGSFPPGFVNPGPYAPFGMVHVGPDTEGPLNYGGYSVQNLLVTGFSQVHMSAGVYKGGQFPLLPFTGPLTPGDLSQLGWPSNVPAYASPMLPIAQTAEPGYYAVDLLRYGVKAELTATTRAALHRYTYTVGAPRVLLDVSRELGGYRPATAQRDADGLLSGYIETDDDYRLYFAARLDAPYVASTADGAALEDGVAVSGEDLKLLLDFPEGLNAPLQIKIGISYVDADGARRNLDAEIPGWDFEAVRTATREAWEGELARVLVEGGSEAERRSFYTALMRVQQFPNVHSDVDGRYRGPDGQVHSDTRPHYSQYSLWDSYRGQNQLLAELQPTRYRDMLRSLLAFHQQAGYLPRWQQGPRDASHMSGDPVIPFIGEGWCRGLLGVSERTALFEAMQSLEAGRRERIALGYIPVPVPGSIFEQIAGGAGVAGTTLEYGIADFALALMADSIGNSSEAQRLTQQSLNYRNLQDPQTGFIRPRHDDGSWLTPFLPELNYGFQEGTSWQYSWLAMHDYAGLVAGMGGNADVERRLDQFFALPLNLVPAVWPFVQGQLSVFGTLYYGNQYAPGNEHDLQAPYVYNYVGAPWKAQLVARNAARIYAPTPLGLPGNDDLGALSGWLAWTMMGLYPMNPGTPLAVVGSPVFSRVTLQRPGAPLVIDAPGAGPLNSFVNGLSVDGVELQQPWLILPREAATITLNTTALPDGGWGVDAPPPSISSAAPNAFGCVAGSTP